LSKIGEPFVDSSVDNEIVRQVVEKGIVQ